MLLFGSLHQVLPADTGIWGMHVRIYRPPNTLLQREGFQAHCVVPGTWIQRSQLPPSLPSRPAAATVRCREGALAQASRCIKYSLGAERKEDKALATERNKRPKRAGGRA